MTTLFNINQHVSVQLTDKGCRIHREEYDKLMAFYGREIFPYRPPVEDANGWSKWQMWTLIEAFGSHIGMGFDPPFNTEIRIHLPKTATLTEEKD